MAAQRLQKGLKASAHEASQNPTDYLHVADPSRTLYDVRRRRGHKADLNSTGHQLFGHARHARGVGRRAKSSELLIECLVGTYLAAVEAPDPDGPTEAATRQPAG
jgi:hypothetical protein